MAHISKNIQAAVQILRQGNPVALPTETVYGLAADSQNKAAIQAVFELKKRPLNHPLILHVAPEWNLAQWVTHIPAYAQALIKTFWPGPLTFVFKCDESKVPSLVRGGQSSVAIRCPNHPAFLNCLRQLGSPLVAPSANPFGKISPTTAEHVADSFPKSKLLIIDGGRCQIGIESTILDARYSQGFQILRHGMIKESDTRKIVDAANVNPNNELRVSGRLNNHYQPNKPLYAFETNEEKLALIKKHGKKLYLIDYKGSELTNYDFFFSMPESPDAFAYELYFQLRIADKSNAMAIAIRIPPMEKSWSAIRERIIKASQK